MNGYDEENYENQGSFSNTSVSTSPIRVTKPEPPKKDKPKANLHERKTSSTSSVGELNREGKKKERKRDAIGTWIGFTILENTTNKPTDQEKINVMVSRFQNNCDASRHLGIVGENASLTSRALIKQMGGIKGQSLLDAITMSHAGVPLYSFQAVFHSRKSQGQFEFVCPPQSMHGETLSSLSLLSLLLEGLDDDMKESFELDSKVDYKFARSNRATKEGRKELNQLVELLEKHSISSAELFRAMALLLHLGNVRFEDVELKERQKEGKKSVLPCLTRESVLHVAASARLMGVNPRALEEALAKNTFDSASCNENVSALLTTLYSLILLWIIAPWKEEETTNDEERKTLYVWEEASNTVRINEAVVKYENEYYRVKEGLPIKAKMERRTPPSSFAHNNRFATLDVKDSLFLSLFKAVGQLRTVFYEDLTKVTEFWVNQSSTSLKLVSPIKHKVTYWEANALLIVALGFTPSYAHLGDGESEALQRRNLVFLLDAFKCCAIEFGKTELLFNNAVALMDFVWKIRLGEENEEIVDNELMDGFRKCKVRFLMRRFLVACVAKSAMLNLLSVVRARNEKKALPPHSPPSRPSARRQSSLIVPASASTKILAELIETEKIYIDDLHTLIMSFYRPLELDLHINKDKAILSRSELDTIFGNISQVLKANQELLSAIQAAKEVDSKNNVAVSFALKFEEMVPFLKTIYSVYIRNYPVGLELLSRCVKTNRKFASFLAKIPNKLTLESYLIKPVQRLCKYPLFFKQLVDTGRKEEDEELLGACLKAERAVNLVAGEVNLNQSTAVKEGRKLFIAEHLIGLPASHSVLEPARELFGDFACFVDNGEKEGDKTKSFHCFVYVDALVITKPHNGKFKFKFWLDLNNTIMEEGEVTTALKLTYLNSLANKEEEESNVNERSILNVSNIFTSPIKPFLERRRSSFGAIASIAKKRLSFGAVGEREKEEREKEGVTVVASIRMDDNNNNEDADQTTMFYSENWLLDFKTVEEKKEGKAVLGRAFEALKERKKNMLERRKSGRRLSADFHELKNEEEKKNEASEKKGSDDPFNSVVEQLKERMAIQEKEKKLVVKVSGSSEFVSVFGR